ncbi:adenylate/guanylate cyclase domain-containing protein [Leptolyngbya sp. FACHB-16]|uniref:adenylate/guanylate cyclase domain-containing protein n=1 Tax=unclassified Leptolyngbya TaxID=2650499 RepID=UPI0016825715|nr:adenylate/guanylate cyclase domain-containing protein [Leptolyngbya sp. FACHB-16]MBD1912611.1 adenylate/guanylate cyclase domain-containing protein [Leptolyngbya sp. FACHB-8]MBD2156780.1 adenylate/guanylate cyclase domain-containing protein [Leptolyngbya sp. FACHB-16]
MIQRIRVLWEQAMKMLFPVEQKDYVIWRQQFLRRRLGLTLKIAITAYLTFIMLRLVPSNFRPDEGLAWLIMATASLGCLSGLLAFHNSRLGWSYPAVTFLGASWSITLTEQLWATLQGVAFPGIFSWTLVFLTQATLMPVRWPLHLLAQLGVLTYYVVVNGVLNFKQISGSDWNISLWLYLFWFCSICNISVFLYERLQRAEFRALKELEAEREKSERLLLNILPEAVAQQLKQDQRTIAEQFSEVSVLFADIVGFTEMSAGRPPVEIVNLLNQIFSEFDFLAETHGLEKIKTIGDSYMVVGGLPIERADHLEAIADMALDMQQAIVRFSEITDRPFQMRIGINSGPVVAGVIGVKKFIYDLWGDTVNTASRMEAYSVPGGIQVTESVYQRLKKRYDLEERGEISVKGKGSMRVYLLKGKTQNRNSAIFRRN